MNFEFHGVFWIYEDDLKQMVSLVKNTGCSVADAINNVVSGWDDCDFYTFGLVEEQVTAEIEKRLTSTL